MTLDASAVIQGLVLFISSLSAWFLRRTLTEIKELVDKVNRHSESLAAGNQRFTEIERRLGVLERALERRAEA